MKLSLDWIRDYVALPQDVDMTKLAYDLTMSTVEVEGVTYLAESFKHILVGRIEEVLPHPNAQKLRICRTDIGGEVKEIVCGGSNLEAGMKVAVACPGAMVRWHGEGEPVEIGIARLRGVESYGMICASSEIGLGDLFPAAEEAMILDLSAFDAEPGTGLADALDLNDCIMEIDNKSMTNRPDLWGHYGIARELAALYNLPLCDIEPYQPPEGTEDFPVSIEDDERCPRYIGVRMEGVGVKPSPFKMQSRIWRVGMRPINALVDITNYVMLATGQPTHAFDADNISGGITVRRALPEEKLLLLNGRELTLDADDLVIADSEGAVALAGVMGGSKDSILPDTDRVILEVANFDSRGIRRTALRYDNRTEASARYEKAVDPQRCEQALSFAMTLFAELYPQLRVTGFRDLYPRPLACNEIDVDMAWLDKRLGQHLTDDELKEKLERMGFGVSFADGVMHVTVPSWRSTGDISIKDDIMEEVARMVGYDRFEPTPITTSFEGAINQLDIDLVRHIKEYLAFRCGMQEVFTYPWMKDSYAEALLESTEGVLKLTTPPAPDESMIRSSLLPNLCEAVAKNERYFTGFSIFEEAQVFADRDYSTPYDPSESLPFMARHIAGAVADSAMPMENLFRTAKGIVEYMPRMTHMEDFTFRKEEKPCWADDTVWLNLFVGDVKVGDLALLSKKTSLRCGIKKLSVMLFDIDTEKLVPFRSRTNRFEHLDSFPTVDFDISLLFDASVRWEEIRAAIQKKMQQADSYVKSVCFVDEYKGKQVPDGKKSVTARLTIGADDRTLKSEEIETCALGVVKALEKKLGAMLRGSLNA